MLSRLAWPLSIALHALVLFALAKLSLPVADLDRRSAREVIRFELRSLPVATPRLTRARATATLEEIAMPEARRRIERARSPDAQAAGEPASRVEAEPRAEPIGETFDEAIAEEVAAEETEPVPGAAPAADFEALRREAVAAVIEQAERDAAYRQFSIEDLIDEPLPEDAEDVPSVFDVESSGRSRRGALAPGTQRTALGRRIAALCNELTGGFGVFGMSLCAEPGARADAFGHLRPQYMESLPVCTEVDVRDAQTETIEDADGGVLLLPGEAEDAEPVIKCRLVPREERIDGARPDRQR